MSEYVKIQLLREFLVLSEGLNFTRAAQKLHITQPVLSRHIKDLETYFSVELLRRDTHNVTLTSAGHVLSEEVRKITQQYDESLSVMHAFTGQSRRQLSIVYLGEAMGHLLVDVIDHFRQQHQDVAVSYRDSELDEALELVKSRQYDLGFVLRPSIIPQLESFCSLPFHTDPLCVVVNRHHELADRSIVSLKDVIRWPVIRVDPREFPWSENYSTDFFKHHGLDFTLYKEYPNLKTCCFHLELNRQAALLMPRHRSYLLSNNCVLLELAEQDCWFSLELVWERRNTNPCVEQFIRAFKTLWARQGRIAERVTA